MSDSPNVPEITVQEAETRAGGGALIIDVREQHEYVDVHIPGSWLIPLTEFNDRYGELPKDKLLIMQCRSGARSARATKFLLEQGYSDVVNLGGGILAWEAAGLPVERDNRV